MVLNVTGLCLEISGKKQTFPDIYDNGDFMINRLAFWNSCRNKIKWFHEVDYKFQVFFSGLTRVEIVDHHLEYFQTFWLSFVLFVFWYWNYRWVVCSVRGVLWNGYSSPCFSLIWGNNSYLAWSCDMSDVLFIGATPVRCVVKWPGIEIRICSQGFIESELCGAVGDKYCIWNCSCLGFSSFVVGFLFYYNLYFWMFLSFT